MYIVSEPKVYTRDPAKKGLAEAAAGDGRTDEVSFAIA